MGRFTKVSHPKTFRNIKLFLSVTYGLFLVILIACLVLVVIFALVGNSASPKYISEEETAEFQGLVGVGLVVIIIGVLLLSLGLYGIRKEIPWICTITAVLSVLSCFS